MSIESRSRQYGKVFDHWQIKEFLGSGSGGKTAVFRLVRSDSNRGVSALKVINLIEVRGNIHDLSEFRRREYETARDECSRSAEQEVWLMDDLRGNTNIVDYLDHTFVDWSDENSFGRDLLIRMELLKDLRSELQKGRAFSEMEALKIGSDICIALIRCHKKNILHRDIKPENIFRNKDGDYKLGDFGVSRVLDACPGAVASTGIGTYEYWPAEQMMGRYDKRVDIYSLGLVLYELCNQNRLPFAATTYVTGKEVSMRLAGTPLPEPIDASPALSEVILKACAFDPEDRYQSAEELLRALNQVIRRYKAALISKEKEETYQEEKRNRYYATMIASSDKHTSLKQHQTEFAQMDSVSRSVDDKAHSERKKEFSVTSKKAEQEMHTRSALKEICMVIAYFLSCFWLMIPLIIRGLFFFFDHYFRYGQYIIRFDPTKCVGFLSGVIFAQIEDTSVCNLLGGISFTASDTIYGAAFTIVCGITGIVVPLVIAVIHLLKSPKAHCKKYAAVYLTATAVVLIVWLVLFGIHKQNHIESDENLPSGIQEDMLSTESASAEVIFDTTPAEASMEETTVESIKIVGYKVSMRSSSTAGVNQNGDTVWWCPTITLNFEEDPEIVQVYPDFDCSYVERAYEEDLWNWVRNSNDTNDVLPYVRKKNGSFGFDYCIYMPDDPSYAGRYGLEFVVGDQVVKTVNFTLTYAGNYTIGTGWDLSNVVWH